PYDSERLLFLAFPYCSFVLSVSATSEISPLSLHDALPILPGSVRFPVGGLFLVRDLTPMMSGLSLPAGSLHNRQRGTPRKPPPRRHGAYRQPWCTARGESPERSPPARRRSEERRVGKEWRCRWAPCISSRRRHTRFSRDWSSDVCSSDLGLFLVRDLTPMMSGLSLPAGSLHNRQRGTPRKPPPRRHGAYRQPWCTARGESPERSPPARRGRP